AAADRRACRLADDRDDRLMVELRVVEPVQKMDRAGARGREAHADLAGEFRVAARHERGHFLVAHLYELELAAGAVERTENAVDAVARKSVDPPDAPFREALEQEIAHCL